MSEKKMPNPTELKAEIEKAADVYSNSVGSVECYDIIRHNFIEGAKWGIENSRHDETVERAKEIIGLLLEHLPDNGTEKDWNWCWNKLSGDSQEKVKDVRNQGTEFLSFLSRKEG